MVNRKKLLLRTVARYCYILYRLFSLESVFSCSVIFTFYRAAFGLRQALISNEDRFYTYCNKIFAGWDFCITDGNAAKLKQSSLMYELKVGSADERIISTYQKHSRPMPSL